MVEVHPLTTLLVEAVVLEVILLVIIMKPLVVVMLLVLLVPRGPASPKADGSTAGVLTERRGKTGAVAKGDEDHVDLEGLDLPLV